MTPSTQQDRLEWAKEMSRPIAPGKDWLVRWKLKSGVFAIDGIIGGLGDISEEDARTLAYDLNDNFVGYDHWAEQRQ